MTQGRVSQGRREKRVRGAVVAVGEVGEALERVVRGVVAGDDVRDADAEEVERQHRDAEHEGVLRAVAVLVLQEDRAFTE